MSASREKKKRQEQRLDDIRSGKKVKNKARSDKFRRGVVITIVCILVLAIAALAVVGSGLPQKNMTALTIDGVNITVAEYNYHYFTNTNNFVTQMYNSYGIDYRTSDLSKEQWSEDMTIADYLHNNTVESLKQVIAQSELARSNGIGLTEPNSVMFDYTIKSYSDAADSNNMSVSNFLAENYGYGVDENILKTAIERIFLSAEWEDHVAKNLTDDEVEAEYSSNKETYDRVTYHTFTFSGKYDGDTTDMEEDEKTKLEEDAKAAAKEKADDMLARVTTADAFKALSEEYKVAEDEDEGDEEGDDQAQDETDDTLKEKAAASSMSTAMKEYLFDEARVSGDKAVVESGTDYNVVLFIERGRLEDALVSVRHILKTSAEDYENATDEQKAAAHTKCEELLAEWTANGATEAAFASLAVEHTEDTGSTGSGGLYSYISNSGWEEGFAAWAFDSARNPGDTGVVDTAYGSHAMYFVSHDGPQWAYSVRSDMLKKETETLVEAVAVTEHSFALSLARTTK